MKLHQTHNYKIECELIFKTNQISEGWDGRVNSQIAEIDAYVYKISYQYLSETGGQKKEELVGVVTLMM